jgi:hypothetical protein
VSGTVRFLADEDFDNDIVRGILRRYPDIDIVRVQAVGLSGRPDAEVLDWAARESRVLLTYDVNTMLEEAYRRVEAGLPMSGVFAASRSASMGRVIEDMALLAEGSLEGEWEGQVRFLPL